MKKVKKAVKAVKGDKGYQESGVKKKRAIKPSVKRVS